MNPPDFGAESEARVSAAEEISAISELTFHSTVLAMLNRWKQVNPGRVHLLRSLRTTNDTHTHTHTTRHAHDQHVLTISIVFHVQAVFFVLDQMELFTKSKQNLLYSLLNLMQEKEPPVAIIGMAGVLVRLTLVPPAPPTARLPLLHALTHTQRSIDGFCLLGLVAQHIMDMLEKRVKSRFSDRYILFLPNASIEQALHILR
jgi:xanthosine utilization system XapX-like protein